MDTDVNGPGMAPRGRCRPRTGFALVEVLVASLLLAIGAVGVAGSLRQGWRSMAAAAQGRAAVGQLADLAEGLRSVPHDERGTIAAGWQQQAGTGSNAAVQPVADGVASWQASLEWPDRALSRPVRVAQSISLPE
jgi:prepilin-type N-terminal cleavage/methylation domain-containing protein